MKGAQMHIDPQHPTPELLLACYAGGMFPMADPDRDVIEYFSPEMRAVVPLDDRFHVPKNVSREVRRGRFEIRCDTAFEQVMRFCARPRSDWNRSWMNERLLLAYLGLFERGQAHSVEAWRRGELVGGLYGVHIGAAFCGESMFVRPALGGSNASKVCLVHLVHWLRRREFTLLDAQVWNEHLAQFGCFEMPRQEYLSLLHEAIAQPAMWGDFSPIDL
jgi:leucyl/phenylalanyl-tRNA---protein transferase